MQNKNSLLYSEKTLIIFSYVAAGLGHLRVTDALYDSFTGKQNSVIFESKDKTLTYFHRIVSIHPILRSIFELCQKDFLEDIFTYFYKKNLHSSIKTVTEQLESLIENKKKDFNTIIIIATHFYLAHKLAKIKDTLERKYKIKLYLFLQVTDDSPQHIWYVPEADMIFVPSVHTKQKLFEYQEKAGLGRTRIEVIPYPISSILRKPLLEEEYKNRMSQYDPISELKINVNIPISGAAVGMGYFRIIISELHKLSQRFKFEVIARKSTHTKYFLNFLRKYDFIALNIFNKDREVVDFYERIYDEKIFGFEITKPSEQAFKALTNPKQRGGSILLFSDPVGRQEFDNLHFLQTHHLIPSDEEQTMLWKLSDKNQSLKEFGNKEMFKQAVYWRGVQLYKNPYKSAKFILWCLKENIFSQMGKFKIYEDLSNNFKKDIKPNGVDEFWRKIEEYLYV